MANIVSELRKKIEELRRLRGKTGSNSASSYIIKAEDNLSEAIEEVMAFSKYNTGES